MCYVILFLFMRKGQALDMWKSFDPTFKKEQLKRFSFLIFVLRNAELLFPGNMLIEAEDENVSNGIIFQN